MKTQSSELQRKAEEAARNADRLRGWRTKSRILELRDPVHFCRTVLGNIKLQPWQVQALRQLGIEVGHHV